MGGVVAAIAALALIALSVTLKFSENYTTPYTWFTLAGSLVFALVAVIMLSGIKPPTYTSEQIAGLMTVCQAKPDCKITDLMDRIEGKTKNGN